MPLGLIEEGRKKLHAKVWTCIPGRNYIKICARMEGRNEVKMTVRRQRTRTADMGMQKRKQLWKRNIKRGPN